MAITGTDKGGAVVSNLPNNVLRIPLSASANLTVSGAGAAVTLSFATVDAGSYIMGPLHVGYDAAPTGGLLTVQSYGGTSYYQLPIVAGGPVLVDLSHVAIPVSTGVKVILAGGGGSIKGYINAHPHVEK